jgi:hypothetical protein
MFRKLLAVSAFAFAAFAGPANADTVAKWTFETSAPLTAGPFSPEIGAGSAIGFHAGAATYSSPAGNGSAKSFSSNTWAVGDYYQFQVSTLGFNAVSLSWDQTSSNTGPKDFQLQYSTNGSTFTSFASYAVLANGGSPNASWNGTTPSSAYGFTFNLSSITSLNNQAAAYFRLRDNSTVSANGGVVSSGGTDRIDNFTVSATPVPEPETYAMLLAGLAVVGFIGRGRKK